MSKHPLEEVFATWSYHPLREEPRRAAMFGAFLVVVWILAFYWFQLWGLLLTMVLTLGSVSGYILRSEYKLTGRGVEVKTLIHHQRFKWAQFVAFRDYPDAIQIFFDPRDLRGRILKAVLMFYDDNHDEVRSIVERYLDPDEERS